MSELTVWFTVRIDLLLHFKSSRSLKETSGGESEECICNVCAVLGTKTIIYTKSVRCDYVYAKRA